MRKTTFKRTFLFFVFTSLFRVTKAFTLPHVRPASSSLLYLLRQPTVLFGRWNNDDDEYQQALKHNKARTDVRNFLTQRAIQSFIYLLIECRDPHTVRWMEQTCEFKNLESFHGTGALNLTKWSTWDSLLDHIVGQPKDTVIVSAKRRGRGRGGWSPNNPYLKDRYVEFRVDIDPVSLATRILSVREQIGREWLEDLETLRAANEEILDSYHDIRIMDRDDEDCLLPEEGAGIGNADDCFPVENLIMPYSRNTDESTFRRGGRVFERLAMVMLGNTMIFRRSASSPQRKANFDLLYLLLTQESLHRVLRQYREAGDDREVSYEWLREFYLLRVSNYFDGFQPFGRADDFLEQLLMAPPSTKTLDASRIGLIDPLRIAEDVIRMRSVVAIDWKEEVAAVPQDHMDLRKKALARQMSSSVNPSLFAHQATSRYSEDDAFQ